MFLDIFIWDKILTQETFDLKDCEAAAWKYIFRFLYILFLKKCFKSFKR